tara:strand:- start:63544 stop:64605 length:1062 start_codon:yes stop_codon:yes gene_type:complete
MRKNILIIGTGTIGEPLIGLLADYKKKLELDIYFHKRTPLIDEIAKVDSLIARGANLVVDKDRVEDFQKLGHEPVLVYEAALNLCDVIIDCTPAGNAAKESHYLPIKNKKKTFIAQGSEKGFGMPYAYGINDSALQQKKPQFIQVVSCNTHNICSILKSLSPNLDNIVESDFVCIRRANDISQTTSFIPSPEIGAHNSSQFGTHHAQDAAGVLNTMHKHVLMFSSAMKVNSQYMHSIRFSLSVKGHMSKEAVTNRFKENPFVALTQKKMANKVFSFGRDHGYYGRIFNQTVISVPSLHTISVANGCTKITGFCFTPQDGNSLLSSVAAALHAIYGKKYQEYMNIFDEYLFKTV